MALHDPVASSWRNLSLSQNDQALVTLTGFDYSSFDFLLQLFEPIYHLYSPGDSDGNGFICGLQSPNCGRSRLMTAADCLGLNLAWTCLRGSTMVLHLVFGITGSRVSKWLRFGHRLLIMILSNHPDAVVHIPLAKEIEEYKAAI